MLVDIKTKLADHDTKLAELAPHLTIPTDEESPEEEALDTVPELEKNHQTHHGQAAHS